MQINQRTKVLNIKTLMLLPSTDVLIFY